MKPAIDLFGEPECIHVKGDSYLNKIARHIYDLWERDHSLSSGNSMGEINRKIHLAIMLDSGLSNILNGQNIKENFTKWYLSKEYPTEEETARAIRALVNDGLISIPKAVIVKSEQFRNRISQSQHR